MLTKLTLNNFKCFSKSTAFELRRVNIFTGYNGRGKSTAMQSGDKKAQYLLEQQENDIDKQIKEINVKLAKESAEAEGRTLSNTEMSLIEKKSDNDFQIARVKEKQYYLNYTLLGIQQQKDYLKEKLQL